MSAAEFVQQPIDKRRLNERDRGDYNPTDRSNARARVSQFRANNNYRSNRPENTSVHEPGSGGFTLGSIAQAKRQGEVAQGNARAESWRPEYIYNEDYLASGKMSKEQSDQAKVSVYDNKITNDEDAEGNQILPSLNNLRAESITSRDDSYYPDQTPDSPEGDSYNDEEEQESMYQPVDASRLKAEATGGKYF